MDNRFEMVAKTFSGLEDVLRDELITLGAENVEMGRRMVSFEGDLEMMYKANLCLRTALRVLRPIEKFTATTPDELYDIVREIDWSTYMTPDSTFSIDSTVNSEEFTHSRYVVYRVKDGIVDHFNDTVGRRPSIRLSGADLQFNVHIDGTRVTISLDSSGEPLSRRGYRTEQTEAPINEALAAGIILKTGWRGDCNLADPMCGSGTFLIEAALIAANINPGIYRKEFAFEKWPDFDADLFESLYNDDSGEREFAYKIYGGDIDPEAVGISRRNIKSAQVENMIELSCRPMADWVDNPDPGILVMNPPYGQRLKPEDLEGMFRSIGSSLKKNFTEWTAWIIGPDNESFDFIGLKPTMKFPLLNGSLECSLREFELFGGRYNDFRADGRHLSRNEDEESRPQGPRKMRRISDEEWKKETRKFGGHKDRAPRDKHRYDDSRKDGGSYRKDRDVRDSGAPKRGESTKNDFRRDDAARKEFRRGVAPKKDFRRREGPKKDFRRSEGPKKDFRHGDTPKKDFRRGKGAIEVTPRQPRIPEENEYVVNKVYYRQRRRRDEEETD